MPSQTERLGERSQRSPAGPTCGSSPRLPALSRSIWWSREISPERTIPLDLLKKEQDRITSQESSAKSLLENTEADLASWQEVLSLAIRLAGNCHDAYLRARPKARRRFNDAVLKAVYIKDGRVKKVEFNDPFDEVFSRPSSNKRLSVELTHHNANHLEIGSDLVKVSWTNRFHEPEASARRSELQRRRHQEDSGFHKASLRILKRSGEARYWSEERILTAIRDFHAEEGRPPSYSDFRTDRLPDYATLWRRFGSIGIAISRALADGQAKTGPGDGPSAGRSGCGT